MTPTATPARRRASARRDATTVFPTPVSAPATKTPAILRNGDALPRQERYRAVHVGLGVRRHEGKTQARGTLGHRWGPHGGGEDAVVPEPLGKGQGLFLR